MIHAKPIKSKPILYAVCLPEMQRIAKENGYNLLVHGSMDRDLDLVCVAWNDNPVDPYELLEKLREFLGALRCVDAKGNPSYNHSVLPGSRDSYILHLNYGFNALGHHTDDQWYLDISFTPRIKKD
jgi:hypothetical protein